MGQVGDDESRRKEVRRQQKDRGGKPENGAGKNTMGAKRKEGLQVPNKTGPKL